MFGRCTCEKRSKKSVCIRSVNVDLIEFSSVNAFGTGDAYLAFY